MAGGQRESVGSDSGPGKSEWKVFGKRVEQLRSAAGLTHEDLVLREVCGANELRRIENGTTAPARCTAAYLDERTRAQGRLLNAWARATINTHLATDARPHELDTSTRTIREFHPGAVPSPLRTHDYSTAIDRVCGNKDPRARGWNRTGGLRIVVNETALRTAVGGREVMREQLKRLLDTVRDTELRFQNIPQGATEHPCPLGPFRLLTLGPAYTVAHVITPHGDRPTRHRAW